MQYDPNIEKIIAVPVLHDATMNPLMRKRIKSTNASIVDLRKVDSTKLGNIEKIISR